ncbi:MAG: NADAR family protein [Candidatus Thiodiazotropha endolucinida]
MLFSKSESTPLYVSRTDPLNPLSSYSKHGFELDGDVWPSVEHYYQGMKFKPGELRNAIRDADHPAKAKKLAAKNKKSVRNDWEKTKETIMTRGIYIKCRSHPEAAEALLATNEQKIIENSQFDYYWGCGRDGRGHNTFGKILMAVREKLREERSAAERP